MSMMKCKECGNQVSKKASQCPHCGAPAKKKAGCGTLLLLGFLGFIAIGVIGSLMTDRADSAESREPTASTTRESSRTSEPEPRPAQAPKPQPTAPPFDIRTVGSNELPSTTTLKESHRFTIAGGSGTTEARVGAQVKVLSIEGDKLKVAYLDGNDSLPHTKTTIEADVSKYREEVQKREAERAAREEQTQKADQARLAMEAMLAEFKWKYHVTNDELTSKPTYIAVVQSINQVSFDFPYQGIQRGELMLRTHPQHGEDLILRVEKGQMLVRSYEDTTVEVVFDEGSPVSYSVVGPSDHGTASLFIRDYSGFVGRMMKAKNVKISVPFYQQGNVVFEFNVSDFDSDRLLNKK